MPFLLPRGFTAAGVHCGLKTDGKTEDLALIHCPRAAVAAGVYTENILRAAPVTWDQARTPTDNFRALVVNSGNANACTGLQGEQDTADMAKITGEAIDASPDHVLVMSTGIIGRYLDMQAIRSGIHSAAERLATTSDAVEAAARGFTTTDRGIKVGCRQVPTQQGPVTVLGIAKGAGMIGPRMATMLCALLTDAALPPDRADRLLRDAVDTSFNCVSVEGHMSTNDTTLLVASGETGPLDADSDAGLERATREICIELAREIADDGEGASHLIDILVRGCTDDRSAHQIARTVADSPLVKTAVTGNDPNWGRIISAAGYAGVPFDPRCLALRINGVELFGEGGPRDFQAAEVSASMRDHRECRIELEVGDGPGQCRFWTSDLTIDYVQFNSAYST